MPEHAGHTAPHRVAPRRHAWALTGFVLGVTSFLLVGPVYLSYTLWVAPWMIKQEYVPSLDYSSVVFWDRLRWLSVLGPEVVVAVVALIVSIITLARWGPMRALQGDGWMVGSSLICAVMALIIFGQLLLIGVLFLAGAAL